jgi:hypothetical protein
VIFHCVNDGVPAETITLLADACSSRELEFVEIDARTFEFEPEDRLGEGDLLYRPAVSLLAQRVEQHLCTTEVATFYADPTDVYFSPTSSPILHQRAGVPVPRTIYCATRDRARLAGYVDRLGGLPIVVKLLGFSGGLGVMVVDTLPSFYSLIDYLVGNGSMPLLCAYVDDAVHWRAVVVGDRMVASYQNRPEHDDFRTYASTDVEDYTAPPPPGLEDVAVRAVRALRIETGGVDVLEHPSGRLYVLEANFPCYFPQAQLVAGVDVAGTMVDHLIAKASG